ncbi:LytR/AlgR family response regulator transcription factor [Taibaiella koreensis]|uniref:LytR/AlgR family response regulator transcription factor n=1 Tax=Taibaiella koreensis TaxID=1268548 RepID=UPI000E59FCF9|nr:LytTR family DNA-binding domain-containing protein [Taibaiella koreensis]
MTCLIIDDEILAQDVIEHYLSRTEGLQLVAKCSNALEAFALLSKEEIDLIFLDIQMPEINGLEFVKILKHPPKIILTTAYTEYALDGYELNVVDYLLKPVSFERFLKAVDKARMTRSAPAEKIPAPSSQDIFVKCDGKLVRVRAQDIRYVEGLKNYLILHTTARKMVVHGTMSNMEEELGVFGHFVRIHKSYLVNKQYITEISGNMIRIEQAELPIGGVYKPELLKLLKVI